MIAKDLPTGVSATPLSASPNLFSMLKPEGCFSFPSARTRSKFLGEACRAASSGCAALSRCISHCSASEPAALTSPSFHPPARPAPSAEKFSLCRTHWILLDSTPPTSRFQFVFQISAPPAPTLSPPPLGGPGCPRGWADSSVTCSPGAVHLPFLHAATLCGSEACLAHQDTSSMRALTAIVCPVLRPLPVQPLVADSQRVVWRDEEKANGHKSQFSNW